MKVLHLIDSGGLYGAERVLLTLVEQQLARGLEPMILSAGEPAIYEKSLESEARKLNLPITPWRMNPGLNLRAAKNILYWAQQQRYQILHSHGYKFNILLGILPRKLRKIPLITTLHGYVQAPRWSKMAIYESLDRWILSRLDAVVIVNPTMSNIRAVERLESGRLHIIPNGIKLESYTTDYLPPELDGFCSRFPKRFLAVGRLSREKGFDILLKAFARAVKESNTDACLAIIGEGGHRQQLEELAIQLRIESRVIFPGYIDKIAKYFWNFNCIVISSHTEGLPMILLEAMHERIPIVATNVGAISWVLDDGHCGTIVPSNSVDELSSALRSNTDENKETIKMTERAHSRLREHYTAQIMEQEYEKLYKQFIRSDKISAI